jgi:hypothetical protein
MMKALDTGASAVLAEPSHPPNQEMDVSSSPCCAYAREALPGGELDERLIHRAFLEVAQLDGLAEAG